MDLNGVNPVGVERHPVGDALLQAGEQDYWDAPSLDLLPVLKADPNIAPLPPHITLAQAKAFASTLLKGDPDEGNVIVETAKQVLDAVLPGHRDK